MDFLFLDYRDPLFSIIILLLVIFVVSFANYWWEIFRQRGETRRISRFLGRFEGGKKREDYTRLISTTPDAFFSLLLLGKVYSKSGEYEEAIKIYLALLEVITEKRDRTEVMTRLGKTYFKAGFMQRSRDILLEALKHRGRNQEALELLAVIYENLREYKKALEVLDSLEELEIDVTRSRAMMEAQAVIHDATLSHEKKEAALETLYRKFPFLTRVYYDFLFSFCPEKAWQSIGEEEMPSVMDIFWNMPRNAVDFVRVGRSEFLKELYSAKGWLASSAESGVFELNVLIHLKEAREIAELEFEFACGSCRSTYPVYFHRCPSCQEVATAAVEPVLEAKRGRDFEASANFY